MSFGLYKNTILLKNKSITYFSGRSAGRLIFHYGTLYGQYRRQLRIGCNYHKEPHRKYGSEISGAGLVRELKGEPWIQNRSY